MAGKKVRDYANKFGIGYQESGNELRITMPTKFHFPALYAWVWFQDDCTVVVSPTQPKRNTGAEKRPLRQQDNLPGCHVMTLRHVRGIGPYFRICETSYRTEGERFLVRIPPEEDRIQPKRYTGRTPKDQVEILPPVRRKEPEAEARRLVLIERGKEELSFLVPDSVIVPLIGAWILEGYHTK